MKEVRWERMFPDQLEAAFAEKPVVYFSYGLCEPHGPHNVVGLDGLKARAIAIRCAEQNGGIVAPPDWWHVHEIGVFAIWSHAHIGNVPRKWLTALPPWVHFKNVCYQLRAAESIGFKAAILLTGHYGPNWEDLKTLMDLIQPELSMRVYSLPDCEANKPGFDGEEGDHAGRVETSLLWALEPECVDVSRLPKADGAGGRAEAGGAGKQNGEGQAHGAGPVRDPLGLQRPPHFAMGPSAPESDRLVGERMVNDEVRYITQKVEEMLSRGINQVTGRGLTTFRDVERFWAERVEPVLPSFGSMQADYGEGGGPPPDSVWHANWHPSRSGDTQ